MEEVRIVTVNSGEVDYRIPNITNYYTSLSTFQILPAYTRSLKFRIKTCSAAFILLSPATNLDSAQFYEICIGAGIGHTTIFHRKVIDNIKNQWVFGGYNDLLSCEEYKDYELNWGLPYGTIYIRSENYGISVNRHDPAPIDIQGVGLMTGWGDGGTWIVEHFCKLFGINVLSQKYKYVLIE